MNLVAVSAQGCGQTCGKGKERIFHRFAHTPERTSTKFITVYHSSHSTGYYKSKNIVKSLKKEEETIFYKIKKIPYQRLLPHLWLYGSAIVVLLTVKPLPN